MRVKARIARVRERLLEESVDAIVLADVRNLIYCTGFEGVFDDEPAHLGIVSADSALLITDSRYLEAFQRQAPSSGWEVAQARESLSTTAVAHIEALGASRVAVESGLPHARFQGLAAAIDAETIEASGWVEELRAVKDVAELSAIRSAQELTDRAFAEVVPSVVRAGATERDIALEIEFFMRRQGSEGVAFSPIVASGPNSAMPHAVPSTRVLAEGDFVVLDFGARVGGYCADMTRTVVVGSASERQREVYAAVLAANRAGEAAVRPGATGAEIDAAARAVLDAAGLGEYFGHGLGHGVGLEVHELPRIGPRSEAPVEAGAVITVEPGVYIPEFGGVRIENLAVVTSKGAEVLTSSPTDLLEL